MKYVIVIPDGCADEPIDALGGKTPLQAADLPATDALAESGALALSNNTPSHLPAGSEVANLCLLGYDPDVYFTGRAPLEAAAQGITLGPHDWAVRCNLVTITDQIMTDFTADHISTEEATELLRLAQANLLNDSSIDSRFGIRAGCQLPESVDIPRRSRHCRAVLARDSYHGTARSNRPFCHR